MQSSSSSSATTTVHSPIDGIYFYYVQANGLRHRLATTCQDLLSSGSPSQSEQDQQHEQKHEHLLERQQPQRRSCCRHITRRRRMLVMFLHGWPECWYNWRHQLLFFQRYQEQQVQSKTKQKEMTTHGGDDSLEFVCVAPDMRGFGGTDQPSVGSESKSTSSTSSSETSSSKVYTQPVIARDVAEIASVLGFERFVVVGHDWGCQVAWSVALLYPQRCMGVCGMSIPYFGTYSQKVDFLTWLETKYYGGGGRERPVSSSKHPKQNTFSVSCDAVVGQRFPTKDAKFHYILYHCLEDSHVMYDENCREFLYRMYGYRKGCQIEPGTPEYDIHGLMFYENVFKEENDDVEGKDGEGGRKDRHRHRQLTARMAPGLWQRIPRPKDLPTWITSDDLEYITSEYQRSGFYGGLCWYRALRHNFYDMKEELLLNLPMDHHERYDKRESHCCSDDGEKRKYPDNDKIRQPSMFVMGIDDSLLKLYGGQSKIRTRLRQTMTNMFEEPVFLDNVGHWVQIEARQQVNEALLRFLNHVSSLCDLEITTTDMTKFALDGDNIYSSNFPCSKL